MKKALITGSCGFIGYHLSHHFMKLGFRVIGVDNLSRKGTDINAADLREKSDFSLFHVDIRDMSALVKVFAEAGPFDLVIHEAGQVAVTSSVVNPREDFEINALGSFNLLEACRMHSPEAVVLYASTNKVYGKMSSMSVGVEKGRYAYATSPQGINEEAPLDFYSPYGCSKGCADQYIRDYHRIYGVRTVVMRQSCIYGTQQFGLEDQGWLAWFVIASLLRRPVTIYGDGRQVRDVLWIGDLIQIYQRVYEQIDCVAGQVFNVGGGPGNTLSLLELLELIRQRGLLASNPIFAEWRPGDQRIFVSDITKANKMLGWSPQICPSQGIGLLVEWASEHRGLLARIFQ